jgi:cytoskeleton protein RodZ
LRDERERKGKQLDDVWRAIKIRSNHLAAIEEGRFGDLPGRAFTIGYVGRYARYLQLDVEKLHARLEVELAAQDGIFSHRINIEPLADRKFSVLRMLIASLLLAVLAYSSDGIIGLPTRAFEPAMEKGLAQTVVDSPVPAHIAQQTHLAALEPLISLPFEVMAPEPVSLRPELLQPIPVIAVTQPLSVRPEFLPPLPVIAVTQPVSLRADLAPAAIQRQARVAPLFLPMPIATRVSVTPRVSLRAELLPHRVQAQLPPGRRYGLQNRNSRITLRVHRPTIVAIRDGRNRIFIDRNLAPGDSYRVPNLVGLWLTAIDASAVEIILDGASVGFAGTQGASVRDLSLNPQSIADRARSTRAGSAPTVRATERTGARARARR